MNWIGSKNLKPKKNEIWTLKKMGRISFRTPLNVGASLSKLRWCCARRHVNFGPFLELFCFFGRRSPSYQVQKCFQMNSVSFAPFARCRFGANKISRVTGHNWVGKSGRLYQPFCLWTPPGGKWKNAPVCLSVTYVVSDTLSGEYEKYKTKNLYVSFRDPLPPPNKKIG